MSNAWWTFVNGSDLAQGDLLQGVALPVQLPSAEPPGEARIAALVPPGPQDVIILTQTCDMLKPDIRTVATAPIYHVDRLLKDGVYKVKDLEEIRTGKRVGLQLLAGTADHADPIDSRLVDFREIVGFPFVYLVSTAAKQKDRPRLLSPYVEYFSQGYGYYIMRVALPEVVVSLKGKSPGAATVAAP